MSKNLIRPPEGAGRSEIVAFHLRQCALELDPKYGKLVAVADELELQPTALHWWIKNGRIPKKACRKLLKRFGERLIDFDRLTGDA